MVAFSLQQAVASNQHPRKHQLQHLKNKFWHYGVRLYYTSFSPKNAWKNRKWVLGVCLSDTSRARSRAHETSTRLFGKIKQSKKENTRKARVAAEPLGDLSLFFSWVWFFILPFDCILSFPLKNAPFVSFIFARSRASLYQCWVSWGLRGVCW